MINIAICEDENHMLHELKCSVENYCKELHIDAHVSCFTKGITLLCRNEIFDIILMDIMMKEMDGMEVMHRLREKGSNSLVIFITAIQDYVFQAFEVDALQYLIKPVSDKSLHHALNKAIKRLGDYDGDALIIAKGSSLIRIAFRDILYCETMNHKLYIHTVNGTVEYYNTLEALEKQLDQRFFRCHRSFIVNIGFVSAKEQDMVIMVNGDRILLSRRKQQEFSQRLLIFLRGEVL